MTVLAFVMALAASPEPSGDFVPGEIMVRFAPGSEADKSVSEVSQQTPLRLETLAPVVETLEARTGFPLNVTQITSGNWVVLKVDVDRLNGRILDRLRGHQNVAQARLTDDEKQFIGYSPPKKIAVKFESGSAEAKTVSDRLRDPGKSTFNKLVSTLEQKVESPLRCEATQQEELLVQIDLKSLTLTLQERLKSLPSVKFTQLNHVMKAF